MEDKGKIIKGGFEYVEMPVQVIEMTGILTMDLNDPELKCTSYDGGDLCSICNRRTKPDTSVWLICKGDGTEDGGYLSNRFVCQTCIRELKDALNEEENI